ncbi:MAG: sugar phosphate isomerase/epimerase [Verrucomicrobiales bacterium]|nr:sugar phosphate isomerase/epimerase [Verrucomicrobiales bacterium]
MNRRKAIQLLGAGAILPTAGRAEEKFALRYVLSSAMFGDLPLESVLAEASVTGAESVDIWRKVHATHREQVTEMGDPAFQELLTKHKTKMSVSTCYPLGPFKQDEEMRWVKKNGGSMTVCGSGGMGEKDPVGEEAKKQVKAFFEKLKPHYELAEELGVTMAIENHKNAMLSSPDSIRYFVELNPSKNVGIAFAPHHLYDAVEDIPKLIREIGKEQLPFFYFQEHHSSSKTKMAKEEELKQMPGFGSLDYVPILEALKEIRFDGLSEIFMHPVPRGIPMLPTAKEISGVINESRDHLGACLAKV